MPHPNLPPSVHQALCFGAKELRLRFIVSNQQWVAAIVAEANGVRSTHAYGGGTTPGEALDDLERDIVVMKGGAAK